MSIASDGENSGQDQRLDDVGRNIVRFAEQSGRALSAFMAAPAGTRKLPIRDGEFVEMGHTLRALAESWFLNPERAIRAHTNLWTSYVSVWANALHRAAGGRPEDQTVDGTALGAQDRRFSDPGWSENQLFELIKNTYLATSDWAERLAEDAEGLDEQTKLKAGFYVKQIANALAPSNFVLTNPALLRETLASNGDNLVRGMRMLAEDIERGEGELRIRQTDPEAFEVGRDLAVTPGKVIFQNELIQLIQYNPSTETVLKRPLLIVPPWINKYYILDLTAQKSFIRWCVDQGVSVFIVSWVNPDESLADKGFDDYMHDGVLAALDAVIETTGVEEVNTIGYCIGGTMLAVALAYLAAKEDKRVASATFFTTQVDFAHAGDLKVFIDEPQLAAIERKMQESGYMDAKQMADAFNMLRSNDLIWPYVINTYLRGQAPFPFDLLHWNSDSTRLPAKNHSFYLRQCYLENALSQRRMVLSDMPIDLSKITMPVYSLAAREDHIAPAKSVFAGCRYFGGPVRYVLAGSGHIAGVINPPSKNKYEYWTGGEASGELADWISGAERHPGSWWPDWMDWLRAQAPETVAARAVGSEQYPPIEAAPGTYVRMTS